VHPHRHQPHAGDAAGETGEVPGQSDPRCGAEPMTFERCRLRCPGMGLRVPERQKDQFARDLMAWRERRLFTQTDAAEFLGVPSVRTLQNWEIGRTLPVGVAPAMIRAAIQH